MKAKNITMSIRTIILQSSLQSLRYLQNYSAMACLNLVLRSLRQILKKILNRKRWRQSGTYKIKLVEKGGLISTELVMEAFLDEQKRGKKQILSPKSHKMTQLPVCSKALSDCNQNFLRLLPWQMSSKMYLNKMMYSFKNLMWLTL